MQAQDIHVTGTLVWYYYICKREVWLMGRHLTPDEDNPNIDLGRFIQEHSYAREKKELAVGHIKMDILRREDGQLVIGEVKKSSKYRNSARMQLAFYLSELKRMGVEAHGELNFPKEKKKEDVILDDRLEAELEQARRDILCILYLPVPPLPVKIPFCKNCAYGEFCWS
ncbi:CRISPR-associated protein Cas4 [candidate division WS5 bacterium]|uniref:CRISPR-associated exonuclease Cas4 n=1 Tax=candidate division WS5 bacterium TaxID=2093353 RepID=A0A419DC98_9BACT|nr:MAG: CRISPR-associated protein Cas4 [candidate division WS5 bacterium]